jgi:hypothetical protein
MCPKGCAFFVLFVPCPRHALYDGWDILDLTRGWDGDGLNTNYYCLDVGCYCRCCDDHKTHARCPCVLALDCLGFCARVLALEVCNGFLCLSVFWCLFGCSPLAVEARLLGDSALLECLTRTF